MCSSLQSLFEQRDCAEDLAAFLERRVHGDELFFHSANADAQDQSPG